MPRFSPYVYSELYRQGVPECDVTNSSLDRIGAIVKAANKVARRSPRMSDVDFTGAAAGFRLALTLMRANPELIGQLAAEVDAAFPPVDREQMVAACLEALE